MFPTPATMARVIFALAMVFLCSGAAAQEYFVLLDLDDDPATGCDVAFGGETFAGAEQRLTTTVTAGDVTAVTREDCIDPATDTFGAPSPITMPFAPPWPVGGGLGTDGSDVVETYYPLANAPGAAVVRLGFASTGANGDDALFPDKRLILDPLVIPTLSEWGLMALVLLLAAAAWWTLRRHPRGANTLLVLVLVVTLAGGVAWAAIVLDGSPDDWAAGDLCGLDPIDTPATGADLRAAFSRVEAGILFLRLDAFGNTPPVANDDAFATSKDAVLNVPAPGVLGNDVDPDAGPMPLAVGTFDATSTEGATVSVNADGSFSYDPTGVAAIQALDDGDSLDDTFTYTADDGAATSAPATVTITVSGANDPPVANDDTGKASEDAVLSTLTGGVTSVLANDTDPDTGDSLTVAAFDAASAQGATVNVNPDGTFTYDPTASATLQALAAGAQTIDTFDYTANDGTVNSTTDATVTITVNGANDPPAIDLNGTGDPGTDFAATFTEGGGAVVIVDVDLAVSDVDSPTLQSAAVTITNLQDAGQEILAANTGGTSITASYAAPTLTLSGADTLASYEQVLRTVSYDHTSANPTTAPARTVSFQVSDGAAASNLATSTVTINATNDAPIKTPGGGGPVSFTEDLGAVTLDGGVTLSDPDDVNLESATVTITNLLDAGFETLAANTGGTSIVASYVAPTLSLSGTDTVANYQQVLRSVTYDNTDQDPDTTDRVVSCVVNDGDADSGTSNVTVQVTAQNDAPTHTGSLVTPNTFTEDGGPVVVDGGIVLADPDDVDLESATVTITNLLDAGEEVLAANTGGTSITASYVAPTLTLSGTDTLANYQQVLRSVTYENTSEDPDTTDRVLSCTVDDGDDSSSPENLGMQVAAQNDGPTHSGSLVTPNTFTEDGGPVVVDGGIVVSDPDDVNLESATVTITNLLDAGFETLAANTGGTSITASYVAPTLTLTGTDTVANYQQVLRSVTYDNTDQDPDTTQRVLTCTVDDGDVSSTPDNLGMQVVAQNDAPTHSGSLVTPNTHTEDGGPVVVDGGIVLADPDDANLASATVTITNLLDAGFETLAANTGGTSITASYVAPTLTLTGPDTLANFQQVLRSVTYENTDQDPDTTQRALSCVVSDGTDPSATETLGMQIVEQNDPPTVTNSTITYNAIGNTLLRVDSADADNHDLGLPGRIASSVSLVEALAAAGPMDVDSPGASLVFTPKNAEATDQGGTITLDDDGDFHYTPPIGFTGMDTETLEIVDGEGGMVPVTLEINVAEMIWYVEDTVDGTNNPAGNADGRSTDAFQTLAAAEAASGPGHIILVFETDAPLDEGITLQSGQRLYGQRVEEETVSLLPAGLILEEIADTDARPQIHRTSGAAVTVDATAASLANVEIRHLDLQSGDDDAVAVTIGGANTASVVIDENVIGAASVHGIDVDAGHAAGTSTVEISDNQVTSTQNAIDVVTTNGGDLELRLITNTGLESAGGRGLRVEDTGGAGTLFVTALDGNSVSGNTAGDGMFFGTVVFDADTGTAGFQQVDANDTAIGAAANGVGGAGLLLTNVRGDLRFGDLDVETTGGVGLRVANPALTVSDFQIATQAGSTVVAAGGPALDLDPMTASLVFASLSSTGSTGAGIRLDRVVGNLMVSGTTTINSPATAGIIATNSDNAGVGTVVSDFGNVTITNPGTDGIFLQNNTGSMFDFGALGDLTTSSGRGIFADDSGTVTISSTPNVSATGGEAVDVRSSVITGNSGWTLNRLTVISSGGRGVNLDTVTGAFNVTDVASSIASTTGSAFRVNAGTDDVGYAGSITNTAGRAVEVTNRTGATVTFSGPINDTGAQGVFLDNNDVGAAGAVELTGTVTVNNSTVAAVTLQNSNSGATRFSNLVVNNSTSNQPGVVATANAGGRLDVDTGSVHGGTATAIDLDNTALGNTGEIVPGTAGGLTLVSASSIGGAAIGIDIRSTTGGFTIAGNGASAGPGPLDDNNGSGGAIHSKTGDAIFLDNATNISLGYMNLGLVGGLSNVGGNGIRANGVNGFTLTRSNLRNIANQNSPDEAALFATEPAGAWMVTNSLFDRSFDDHIRIENSTVTSGFTFDLLDSTLRDNDASGNGNDGLLYIADGGGTDATFTVRRNVFDDSDGDHVQVALNGNASADVTIGGPMPADGNNLGATLGTVLGSGITLSSGQDSGGNNFSGLLTYLIQNNDIQNAGAESINVNLSATSTAGVRYQGAIDSNTIGTVGTTASGGFGIGVTQNGAGVLRATINNNTIREYDGDHGLLLEARDGSGRLDATVTGNTISNPTDTAVFDGLGINAGATGTDTSTVCADIRGNNLVGSAGAAGGGADFAIFSVNSAPAGTTIILPGYGGAAKDNAAIVAFIQGNNDANPLNPAIQPPAPSGFTFFTGNSNGVSGAGAGCP